MTGSSSTVAGVLREQARDRGDHPLLVCDDDRLSYAEAERRSALLARGLIALGAGKGTHVGLLYPNGSEFVVAMLAAARIGAVVVPFSTFATAPELREQLLDSDVVILLPLRPIVPTTTCSGSPTWRMPMSTSADTLFSAAVPQLRHVVRRSTRTARSRDGRCGTADGDGGRRRRLAIRWRSCTPRGRPAQPRAWCTPTRLCSRISATSTTSAA